MVASNRLVNDLLVVFFGSFFVIEVFTKVAVDTHPVHFATTPDLPLAHNGNVVFGLASDHACVATIALVEVDSHPPNIRDRRILLSVLTTNTGSKVFVLMVQVKDFGPRVSSVAAIVVAIVSPAMTGIFYRLQRNVVDYW